MLLVTLIAPSLGATLTVGPVARTHTTLGAAVAASQNGDTILVDAGTYAESVIVSKSLTIAGEGGAFTLTGTGPVLDLNGTPTVIVRDMIAHPTGSRALDSGAGSLTLERVTVRGGVLTNLHGAGLHASGGTVVLTDCVFDDNIAPDEQGGHIYAADTTLVINGGSFTGGIAEKGGAIWMLRGSLTATGTTFSGNRANAGSELPRGGAIRSQDAPLSFTDCTFDDNAAIGGYGGHVSTNGGSLAVSGGSFEDGLSDDSYGGALALYQTTATLRDAAFRNNAATVDATDSYGHGGAVIAYGAVAGSLLIEDCEFQGNTAEAYGGAVRVETGATTITRSTFTSNSAEYGGALHSLAVAPMSIASSTFTTNTATLGGGAIRWRPNDATIGLVVAASTFDGNTAGGPGGALYASSGGAVSISDVEFVHNAGFPGGGVAINAIGDTDVLRSTFCANDATAASNSYGGGLYIWQSGTSRIANSAFIDGVASQWGGGAHVQESGVVVVENSAFLSNTAANGGGFGIAFNVGTFRNNVIVGNTGNGVSGGTDASGTLSFDVWNANVEAHVSGAFSATSLGVTNLVDTDPAFIGWSDDGDCTNDDLRLKLSSPLIDRGDASVLDPDGSQSDIGPYGGPDADPGAWSDSDGDGAADLLDCQPADATVFPEQPEVPYDGVDQDCTGADLTDVDGDGHVGEDAGGQDCDDLDPDINPAVDDEPYDGIDQNCNGEDLVDADGDGYLGEPAGGDDCDDDHDTIHPGAVDVPGNFVDEDCSGADTPGDDVVPEDTGDDDEGRKTCNCGTTDPGLGLAGLVLIGLFARRRRSTP